jgi:hypothetical protein
VSRLQTGIATQPPRGSGCQEEHVGVIVDRVAGNGDRGKVSLAVVSVLATAAVGIAGSTTTWLVSRDQRATARANRIYERRAATYVAAIDTLERHVKVLANLDLSRVRSPRGFAFEDVGVNDETDRATIRSRLIAFGSPKVLAAFARVSDVDREAFAWVFGETSTQRAPGAEKKPGPRDVDVWRSETSQAIDDLRDALTEFETRLNRELTS